MPVVRVLRNGHFYTGWTAHPWATALALVGGKVAALDREAELWADAPGAQLEDLGGATAIPGLTDAHIHLMWYALSLKELNLRDLSRSAMLGAVRERASRIPPGEWILGRGWDQNLWEDSRFPSAGELDAVAPVNPVMLIAKNAHALVANSLALRLGSITSQTADPPHGRIGRDATASPDGMLYEDAMAAVKQAVPPATRGELLDLLEEAQRHLLALGITSVHDVDGEPALAAFQDLHQDQRLRLRVVKYVRLESLDALLAAGIHSGLGDEWLRLGGLKLFADGALGARTAAMAAPYLGEPDNVGILTLDPTQLREIAHRAAAGGLALAVHAIGDRANHLVLDVFESVRPLNARLRHRLEHVQLIAPEDQPRLSRLGVVASMQPIHATHDRHMAEQYWGARSLHAYAWRSLSRHATVLAFGSDAPIEIFDPFLGLYAAVTRRSEYAGESAEGAWYPEQCLSLEEALRAYTWGAAYAGGIENTHGALAPGMHGDLAVLDRDIFSEPPAALLETRVSRVMVAGLWQDFG